MPVDRTAGIVIIGNEILSGKVTDTNSPFLARELRKLGVTLLAISTIPDDVDVIASTVKSFSCAAGRRLISMKTTTSAL